MINKIHLCCLYFPLLTSVSLAGCTSAGNMPGQCQSCHKGPQPTAFTRTYISAPELKLWDQLTQSILQILFYVLPVCRAGVILVAKRTLVLYLLLPGLTDGLSKEEIQDVKNTKSIIDRHAHICMPLCVF